jgi:acyl-coenzyme A thioesterase PaaI-like protein
VVLLEEGCRRRSTRRSSPCAGKPVDTHAAAVITKRGRRVINVRAEAWQEDRARPIATAFSHFLVMGEGAK